MSGAAVESLLHDAARLHAAGDARGALDSCKEARRLAPDRADVLRATGALALQAGETALAVDCFRHAEGLPGANAEACFALGVAVEAAGDLPGAADAYRRALRREPGHYGALLNGCAVALALRRPEEAEALGRRLVETHPDQPDAWLNLAQACFANVRYGEADRALEGAALRWPGHLGLRIARVVSQAMNGRTDAAQSLLDELRAMRVPAQVVNAIPGAQEVFAMDADRLESVRLTALFERRRVGEWDADPALRDGLVRLAARVRNDPATPVHPAQAYQAMAIGLDCRDYLSLARRVSARTAGAASPLPPPRPGSRTRLRIGYLSPSFRDHPNAWLYRGLLAAHDRARFEVFGYSLGPDDRSPARAAIIRAVDRFVDLAPANDVAAARRIRDDDVDILIDLGGYFDGARPGILAARPARLQFSYTGMLGLMEAPYLDYRLADRLTDGALGAGPFAFEQPVWLPGCLMPYGPSAAPRGLEVRREDQGLPKDAVVLCAFHSDHKVSPASFAAWMAVLSRLPDTVLWLTPGSPRHFAALQGHAAAAGIAPSRLIAAARVDNDAHVARLRCADLYLDTFEYGAHTTAFEALWMDLPVLTRLGEVPAARVAASALLELGIPELVADDAAAYVERAVELARDPALRADIRGRLARARERAALFQPHAKARQLEAAFSAAWSRLGAGHRPAPFAVEPGTAGLRS